MPRPANGGKGWRPPRGRAGEPPAWGTFDGNRKLKKPGGRSRPRLIFKAGGPNSPPRPGALMYNGRLYTCVILEEHRPGDAAPGARAPGARAPLRWTCRIHAPPAASASPASQVLSEGSRCRLLLRLGSAGARPDGLGGRAEKILHRKGWSEAPPVGEGRSGPPHPPG